MRSVLFLLLASLLSPLAPLPAHQPVALAAGASCRSSAPPSAGASRIVPLGGQPSGLAVSERWGHVFVLDNGAAGCRTSVVMLDAATGRMLRRVQIGHLLQSAVVDERAGRVLVTDSGDRTNAWHGAVIALDTRTGRLLGTTPTGPETWSIVVDEGTWRAFAVNAGKPGPPYAGRTLSVIAVTRRSVVRTIPLGSNVGSTPLAIDTLAHRVFVQGDAGVLVLDARTGRTLATIPIAPARSPLGPVLGLAADSRTHRLLLLRSRYCGEQGRGVVDDRAEFQTFDSRPAVLIKTTDGPCVTHFGGTYRLVADAPAGMALVTGPVQGGWGVLAIDARSATLVRPPTPVGTESGGVQSSAVDSRTGAVYLAASIFAAGNPSTFHAVLRRFDPRSSAVGQAFTVPVSPTAMITAARARRVFLASSDAGAAASFTAS